MYSQSSFAEALLRGCRNEEPPLAELLADPIVHLLMSSDRVRSADLESLLASAKRQRAA